MSLSPWEFQTCSDSGRFANKGQKLSVTRRLKVMIAGVAGAVKVGLLAVALLKLTAGLPVWLQP